MPLKITGTDIVIQKNRRIELVIERTIIKDIRRIKWLH